MPYPSSQSRPNSRNQPLLFGDDLAETVLPSPSNDGEVAGRILEDRERRLRSNGAAEARFELSSGTSSPAKRPVREAPDRCMTTLPRRRDELYEARVKAIRARLDSRPLLAFFDAPARVEPLQDPTQSAAPPLLPSPAAEEPSPLIALSAHLAPPPPAEPARDFRPAAEGTVATGEKAKAQDILEAIRTLHQVERDGRNPTDAERTALTRFGGFGAVALSLFPDPLTGRYKTPAWEELGRELTRLLSPEEYESARRTTFNAFYTSPVVVRAMFDALSRLGVPEDATVLEPGCGSGNFLAQAASGMRFIGVELDRISGRIAKALHPGQDIRIENYRDSKLPEARIDAVIGNPPFADIRLDYRGMRLPLHDFFLAKSLDALKPSGILSLVTTHFTLDKRNGESREHLAGRADFLGAIRLPSDAFKREGTAVVTDIVFLRKRAAGEAARHVDSAWLEVGTLNLEGVDIAINRYFLAHPEMVLGTWTRKDRLYGGDDGYSVTSNGSLADGLRAAIGRLPEGRPATAVVVPREPTVAFVPPPLLPHITEGSFYVAPGRVIFQMTGGEAVPATFGGRTLKTDGTMTGKRLAVLIELRDQARKVLQSQNQGWPDAHRNEARRGLNRLYDRFVMTYGPVNKTTITETSTGGTLRRMPNLVKWHEDPDAMLVMSLEHYDEATGKATKAAIMQKDVVGRTPPITRVASAEEGLLVSLDKKGSVDLGLIRTLYGKPEASIIAELGELIYRDPEDGSWQTADAYLSENVREKLRAAERAGPEYARNVEALRLVQPEDVLPGDIDANLGAPWIPPRDIEAFAGDLFGVSPSMVRIGHLPRDAVWSH